MQRTMETMFLNLYEEIFKEEGKVDSYSSKEKRKEFIEVCFKLRKGINFGNTKTGEIRIDEVNALRKEILATALVETYEEVFTPKGEIKPCGRERCIELIKVCSMIDPNTDYGSEQTGFLNKRNVLKLRWRV